MRGAPAFHVCPRPSRGWHVGVGALVLLAIGVCLTWVLQAGGASALFGWAALVFTVVCAYLCWRSVRTMPASLRWDGQCWHWGPSGSRGHEPFSGHAGVVMDLGVFMLLRLQVEAGVEQETGGRWLPLSQRDVPAWHLLRCTLYAPRVPMPATGAPS